MSELSEKIGSAILIGGGILLILTILCVAGFMIVTIAGSVIDTYTNPWYTVENKTNTSIVSLYVDPSSTGAFVLGTGRLSDKVQYVIYTKTPNNAIQMIQIPAERTLIYQDATDPYMTTTRYYNERKNGSIRSGPFGLPSYELHVPPNTIIQQYTFEVK
jgi:hypothetical protein